MVRNLRRSGPGITSHDHDRSLFIFNFQFTQMSSLPKPTESEMGILRILWQDGPATVRQVHERLSQNKDAGYTTTLKLMQIMTEKGFVQRDETSRTHVYAAVVSEVDAQKQLLDRFLETAFGGSAAKLVMQALGNHQTSRQELDEIRQLLDKMENRKDL